MARELETPIEHTFASTGLGPDSGLRLGIRKRLRAMAAQNIAVAAVVPTKEEMSAMNEAELTAILRGLGATESAIASAREGDYAGCRCV